jgi:hypothetical protein
MDISVVENIVYNLRKGKNIYFHDGSQNKIFKALYKDASTYIFMNDGVYFIKHQETLYLLLESQRRNLSWRSEKMVSLESELAEYLVSELKNHFPNMFIQKGYLKVKEITCPSCENPLDPEWKERPNPKNFLGKIYQKQNNSNKNKFHLNGLCNAIRREWDNKGSFKSFEYSGEDDYQKYCRKYGTNIWCRSCFYYDLPDPKGVAKREREREQKEYNKKFLGIMYDVYEKSYNTNNDINGSVNLALKSRTHASGKKRFKRAKEYVDKQFGNLDEFQSNLKKHKLYKKIKK